MNGVSLTCTEEGLSAKLLEGCISELSPTMGTFRKQRWASRGKDILDQETNIKKSPEVSYIVCAWKKYLNNTVILDWRK